MLAAPFGIFLIDLPAHLQCTILLIHICLTEVILHYLLNEVSRLQLA